MVPGQRTTKRRVKAAAAISEVIFAARNFLITENECLYYAVLRIRIRQIHMFLGMDPDPNPLVRGADPDPDHQAKIVRKILIPSVL
jgi:hypothetical protein